MDTKNEQQVKRKKVFKDIDVRDVLQYFIAKSWIVVIVVAVCLVAAILYTAFIVPTYQSTSSMLIITDEGSTTQDFSAGQQIINNTPEVIKGNVFCEKVAKMLLNNQEDNGNDEIDTYKELLRSNPTLLKELGGQEALDYSISKYTDGKAITPKFIQSSLSISTSTNAKNTFTVTATTTNKYLSCIISNAVTTLYEDYVKTEIVPKGTNISTDIFKSGTTQDDPSNKNFPKNVAIAVAIGFVVTCAVLFLIFFFDDKIKTPDDIEKHLDINILGAIPDFEER